MRYDVPRIMTRVSGCGIKCHSVSRRRTRRGRVGRVGHNQLDD
jgi:hypothetical protein